VISYGLKNKAADHPDSEGNPRNHGERLQPARIQRFLGERRPDECGEINLLAVGIDARAVERLQRVLIGILGERSLAFELFVRPHHPGKSFRSRLFGICDLALDRPALCLERLDTGLQHFD
jgi:hypothetical protein